MLLTCAHDIELVKQQLWKGGGGSEAKFLTSFLIFLAILKGKAFFKESVSTILKVVVAAREAEFNSLQAEAKPKASTARIESELAQRKVELEQMEAKKQIEIARVKLQVYQEVEEFEDNIDPVENDPLDTSTMQIDLEREAVSPLQSQEPKYSASDRNTLNSTAQPAQQSQDVNQFHMERETTHPICIQPQVSSANMIPSPRSSQR